MAIAQAAEPAVLMDLRETAQLLGMTEDALRWQLHKGTAPRSALIGGKRRFKRTEVLAWIDAHFEAQVPA